MAIVRWIGNALPVAQVETITIANTWAANDTATVTINGKTITMTVGSTATTTEVATQLANVLNSATAALGTGYSATERGPNIGEFAEFTAVASGSTVVCTARVKGKPFTMTTGETTAGSGTCTRSTTTAATGPNHADNGKNYSGGSVPSNGDTLLFDSGSVDVLYGLDQSAVHPAAVHCLAAYRGRIGLKLVNDDNSALPYNEYRDRYLKYGGTGAMAVIIGAGEGQGSSRINIDANDTTLTATILKTGNPEKGDQYAVRLITTSPATGSNSISVTKGFVGIAPLGTEAAVIATLNVSYAESRQNDAFVFCGSGVTLTNVVADGGDVTLNSGTTSIDHKAGTLTLMAGAHTALRDSGGTTLYRSTGTLSAAYLTGGSLDFRQDNRARTVSAIDIWEGSEIHDPVGTVTWTAGIDLNDCNPTEVVLNLPKHKRITLGSVA